MWVLGLNFGPPQKVVHALNCWGLNFFPPQNLVDALNCWRLNFGPPQKLVHAPNCWANSLIFKRMILLFCIFSPTQYMSIFFIKRDKHYQKFAYRMFNMWVPIINVVSWTLRQNCKVQRNKQKPETRAQTQKKSDPLCKIYNQHHISGRLNFVLNAERRH